MVTYGGLAVAIFFSISGYLVTQSWVADPNLWRFILKRLLRIMPALIVVTLASIFFIGPLTTSEPLNEYFSEKTTWQYLYNIYLKTAYELPGVFLLNPYPKAVNGSLWTLPMEFQWYLVVAALGFSKLIRIKPLLIMCWPVLAWWVDTFNLPGQKGMDYFWCFGLFFFGGMVLASVEFSRKYLLAACILAVPFFYWNEGGLAIAILIPIGVICLGKASIPVIRSFGKFGDISYGVYIFAFPTQQTIVHFLGASRPFPMLLLCSFIITYGLAYISWLFIEAPALALKKRLYPKA